MGVKMAKLTTEDAAKLVGCSIHTILKYARVGEIQSHKKASPYGRGYRYVFDAENIKAFADRWRTRERRGKRSELIRTHLPGGLVLATHLADRTGVRIATIYSAAKNTDIPTRKYNDRLYVHEAQMRARLGKGTGDQCPPPAADDWHCFEVGGGSQSIFSGTLDECLGFRDSHPTYLRIIRCQQEDDPLIMASVDELAVALECPARGGGSTENELRQDCRECLSESPERAVCCDAIEEGKNPAPDQDLIIRISPATGWENRVLRRAGLEAA